MHARQQLLKIFSDALFYVRGRERVQHWLADNVSRHQKPWVIAIGKAAESMYRGATDHFEEAIQGALVITKYGHVSVVASSTDNVQYLEAGHPYADQNSLDAGQSLLHFIRTIPENAFVLVLISGGTSSLVEVVPEHVDVNDLNRFHRWLVGQGWSIHTMNACRKAISLIKGGRLAERLVNRRVLQLLISDVPGNDVSVIGSGLLVADTTEKTGLPELPDWVAQMQMGVPAAPNPDAECFRTIENHVLADNHTLRNAIETLAIKNDLVVRTNTSFDGEIHLFAKDIARQLRDGDTGVYIWGGEGVIRLPENPGQGGRCQALALEVAFHLQGDDNFWLLAAGSDGTDGPGNVAGALVDGGTIQRGQDAGLDVEQARQHADAGSFLAASGDLVDTGPTGTNVMDIIIALKN